MNPEILARGAQLKIIAGGVKTKFVGGPDTFLCDWVKHSLLH